MVEKTIVLNAETEKATQNVDAFNKGLKETDKSTKKLNKDLKDTKGDLTGVQSSADAATGGLISGFKNSVGAIKGVVKGFKSLKVALAATGIGLIVVLFASLKEAFEDSEEGANKFSRILGVVGTVVDNFLDLLADLGEAIIGVFENPKEALMSFVNLLKNQVVNRITGLMELIPALGKAVQLVFEGEFSEAGKVAANAVGKIALGVEDVTGKIQAATEATKEFIQENIEESKKAIEVADMRSKANKLERELLVERSVLENKIANLRLKSRQEEEFTAEQRKGFILEAQELQDSLLKKETEVLKLRFDAQKAQNEFGRSNIEALDATAEAEAAVNRQSALRLNQQKATQKELNTLNKQIQAEQKAAATEKKRLDDEEIKRSQEKIDAEKKRLDLLKQEQSKADNEEAIRAEQQWNLLQEITNTAQEQELLKLTQQYDKKLELAEGNAELEKALEEQKQIDLAAIDNKYLQASIEAKKKADEAAEALIDANNEKKAAKREANIQFTIDSLTQAANIISQFAQMNQEKFDTLNAGVIEQQQELSKKILDNENLTNKQKKQQIADLNSAKQKELDANNKRAERAFKVQQAASIAQALATTYLSAVQAFQSQFVPIADATSPIRGGIAAGLAVAAGLANVAAIKKQKFEAASFAPIQIPSQSVSSGGAAANGGAGTSPSQAPQFNVVGQSGFNQVAGALGQQQPVQAYVVAGNVTTAQQLQNNTITQATF